MRMSHLLEVIHLLGQCISHTERLDSLLSLSEQEEEEEREGEGGEEEEEEEDSLSLFLFLSFCDLNIFELFYLF